MPILEVNNLKTHFKTPDGTVKAVDGVSFSLEAGDTLGIVGESGSGKSVTALSLMQLNATPPRHYPEGEVLLEGRDLLRTPEHEMQKIRGDDMAMIFQDPMTSLRYPHEFSGGQRQRVGIARAIALNPKLIVCDEPVYALDASIQAQVVNLLKDLQREFDLTYIFVAHDLSVVKHICDRVAVMYLGNIVEVTSREGLYGSPRHPHTNSLLSAIPLPDPRKERERRRVVLKGDVPSPSNPPPGCTFHTRCPRAREYCAENVPPLEPQQKNAHLASCFFPVLDGQSIEGAPVNASRQQAESPE